MPRRVWEAVKTEIREIRVAKTKGRRKEREKGEGTKEGRGNKKKEKTKKGENNRSKEDSKRMRDLG